MNSQYWWRKKRLNRLFNAKLDRRLFPLRSEQVESTHGFRRIIDTFGIINNKIYQTVETEGRQAV